jgi:ankyrin repeat protein
MEIMQAVIASGIVAVAGVYPLHAEALTADQATRRLDALGLTVPREAFARAVALRQPRIVELFLDANFDPNIPDERGRTTLFYALADLDWQLADRLLAAGANPNLGDAAGTNSLMLACVLGDVNFVQTLCSHGAAINAQDHAGRTALHYAIAARKLPVAMALLQSNARADIRDRGGTDPLTLATETRHWPLLETILKRIPQRPWDFAGRSTLQQAITTGEVARVRLVLSKHLGAPAPEGCRSPLLAYAVAAGDLKLTKLLIDAGADPNTTFESKAEKQYLEYIPQEFLRNYLVEEPGMTVLSVAAGLGNKEMVTLLLDKGAERGRPTRSKYKLYPIYFAAWGNHADCIQALIADAPSPDKYRIEISLGSQSATLYRDNTPALHTGISTGKAGFSTPTGQFVITDKKLKHVSTIYKVEMPFFMRLSCRDFGMHEGYVPDYPASHGCIRLPSDAARRLYKEVPIGTLVTITN